MQMLLDQSDTITLCNLGFNLVDKNLERYCELLFLSSYAQFCYNRDWKALILILPLSPNNYSKTSYIILSAFIAFYQKLLFFSPDAYTITYKTPCS